MGEDVPTEPCLWEVVGGTDKGGILVREGKGLKSKEVAERLAKWALVRQVELCGERLRYERLSGGGPDTGWVSLRLKERDLVVKSSKAVPIQPVLACFYSGGFTAEQGRGRLSPFLEEARKAGFKDFVVLDHVGQPGFEDCRDWEDYVDRMVATLDQEPKVRDRPIIIFAHSHGTTPAWGLARRLGSRCLKFYCACKRPPHMTLLDEVFGVDSSTKLASLDNGEMLVKMLDAWPNQYLEPFRTKRPLNPIVAATMEVVKQQYGSHVMPCGSADCKASICKEGDTVEAPILAFAASKETPLGETRARMEGWKELTTGGFELRTVDGTHMAMLELESPLFPLVVADMQALVGTVVA